MKIVLDTSVLVKLFLQEIEQNQALALIEGAAAGRVSAHIPDLAFHEVLSVLTQRLDDVAAIKDHLRALNRLVQDRVLTRHALEIELLCEAAEIADLDTKGHGYVSAYDATFHALAVRLGAVFVTADAAHVRKTLAQIGSVQLLSDIQV